MLALFDVCGLIELIIPKGKFDASVTSCFISFEFGGLINCIGGLIFGFIGSNNFEGSGKLSFLDSVILTSTICNISRTSRTLFIVGRFVVLSSQAIR